MSELRVTLIQTSLFWEDKDANLAMLEQKLADTGKTELVILPEMFTTGFSMQPQQLGETMDGPTVQWMRRQAGERRIMLAGSFIASDSGQYFNRLVCMLPNGSYGTYDKRHLFGYAGEHRHYAPGSRRLIASANGFRINWMICYDLRFPVWARQQVQEAQAPEYDVLVYVANWPEARIQAWRTLLQARAIENQCYVIGVNRVGNDGNGIPHSGNSMIVNTMGEIITELTHGEAIHTETLRKAHLEEVRNRLPFLKDRDRFHLDV